MSTYISPRERDALVEWFNSAPQEPWDGPMPYTPRHLEPAEAATEVGVEPDDMLESTGGAIVVALCAGAFVAAIGLVAVML
jgi:hypothetical protein